MKNLFLKLVLLFTFLYSQNIYSQSLTFKMKEGVDGTAWFQPNIDDMIRMYHMKIGEWESEMILLGAKKKGYVNGKTVYEKVNPFNSQNHGLLEMQTIAKEPEEIFIFHHTNGESSNIFTYIVNELEPHYIKKDEDKLLYGLTKNNNNYLFIVSLESKDQSIRLWSMPIEN